MMKRFRNSMGTLAAALAVTMYLAAPAFAATTTSTSTKTLTTPVTGAVSDGGTFSGTLTITSFAVQNGQVVALGTVSGIVTTAAGVATSIIQNVVAPVTVGQTTCQILHLDVGPISLNVLGLQVNISQIVIDITAQGGSGNLLGNLLCSVAGLLNNPGSLANLLNQILAAL